MWHFYHNQIISLIHDTFILSATNVIYKQAHCCIHHNLCPPVLILVCGRGEKNRYPNFATNTRKLSVTVLTWKWRQIPLKRRERASRLHKTRHIPKTNSLHEYHRKLRSIFLTLTTNSTRVHRIQHFVNNHNFIICTIIMSNLTEPHVLVLM